MAKLVSQPYEQEEQPKPVVANESEVTGPVIKFAGLLIIVLLFLGALYLVFGAFTTQSAPQV